MPTEPRLQRNALVQSRGFRTTLTRFDGDPPGSASFMIESVATTFNDLFGAMSTEIVNAIATRRTGEPPLATFVSNLQRWKLFFDSTSLEGLGDQSLLGLLAELVFLRDFALDRFADSLEAVSGWVGPDPLSKDFQFFGCSIEAKCSASREHTKIHISGERQLDSRGVPALFLFVLLVERVGARGVTVPEVVDEVRSAIGNSIARLEFDGKLLAYGYHDAHREKYGEKRFVIQEHRFYQVLDTFPRLIAPLPNGVGDLSYTVALSACAPFRRPDDEVIRLIGTSI
jgi:hypothetical protein